MYLFQHFVDRVDSALLLFLVPLLSANFANIPENLAWRFLFIHGIKAVGG